MKDMALNVVSTEGMEVLAHVNMVFLLLLRRQSTN
jgi:hypothetical protein